MDKLGTDERDEDREESRPISRKRALATLLGSLGVLLLLALGWRFLPAHSEQAITSATREFSREPWAPFAAWLVFLVLVLLMFPVTVLIVATALIFDGVTAYAISLSAGVSGVAAGHLLGQTWLKPSLERLMPERLARFRRRMLHHGVLSAAVLRLLPIAPFTLVNVLAGAAGFRRRDFVVGSLLAMLPGTAVLTWASGTLARALEAGDSWLALAIGAGLVLAVLLQRFATRRLAKRTRPPS